MEIVSLESAQPKQEAGFLPFETYYGFIESVSDAEKVISAVKRGELRQIFARLSTEEQPFIRSGTVIVWDEVLSGIKRWTDGRSWSASRFQDEFLVYQELPPKNDAAKEESPPSDQNKHNRKIKLPSTDPHKHNQKIKVPPSDLHKRTISIMDQNGRRYHLTNYYLLKDANSILIRPYADPRFSPRRNLSFPSQSSPLSRLTNHNQPYMNLPPLGNTQNLSRPIYHAEDARQLKLVNIHCSL